MTAVEIVLPSGRFARFRPVLAIDILLALKAQFPEAALISRVVTLDGESLSYEQVLNMEAEEFMPVMVKINEILSKIKFKGVT